MKIIIDSRDDVKVVSRNNNEVEVNMNGIDIFIHVNNFDVVDNNVVFFGYGNIDIQMPVVDAQKFVGFHFPAYVEDVK